MAIHLIKITLSLILLFIMLYIGRVFSIIIPIGIPDSIWGMLFLFVCLVIGIIKVEWVLPSGSLLVRYLTVFLIPVCAVLVEQFPLLYQHFSYLIFSVVLSSLLSLIVIGLFAQWIFHRKRGAK